MEYVDGCAIEFGCSGAKLRMTFGAICGSVWSRWRVGTWVSGQRWKYVRVFGGQAAYVREIWRNDVEEGG